MELKVVNGKNCSYLESSVIIKASCLRSSLNEGRVKGDVQAGGNAQRGL